MQIFQIFIFAFYIFMYHVRTHNFEGPLDMLLSMIEERKLSINEVSLASIAGDYIVFLRGLAQFPRREVAQFLVIASTLMLIKSRSLLPQLEIEPEEEQDIKELELRLQQLRYFRKRAKELGEYSEKRKPMFMRETLYGLEIGFIPPTGLVSADMHTIALGIVFRIAKETNLPEKILERIITIEEKIEELTRRIQESVTTSFAHLSREKDKTEVIVSFLALLELLKDGIIVAEQEGLFNDIAVTRIHAHTKGIGS